jgi:arylsulfatase
MTVAEGGIRTPLLIAGPNVNGGRQVDAFGYVWDLMPTILDYAGIEHDTTFRGHEVEPMRGRSMASLLNGSADAIYADDEFVGGEMQNGKWMRQGNYKAVTVSPPYGDGVWRLFDVVSDPGETQNLAAQEPEKLEELQAAWEQYAQDVGVILTK